MFQWLLNHSPLFYFTQSLWRDEVFSIFVAERPITFFVSKMSFETPLYYILLHIWIKVFGTSEIAVRSLSLCAFVAATIVVIVWSEKLFHKHWLSWFLPIFFFFNPMLLYYAFEVRTYSWYVLFAVLSMFAYTNKRWFLLILSSVLGFYIHSYFIFVPIVQVFHWIITNVSKLKHPKHLLYEPMVRANLFILMFIAPWLLKIFLDMSKLKNSWYFPVDINLVKSVLGNVFLGYEGTPWYLWTHTRALSLGLLLLIFLALRKADTRKRTLYFALAVFLPLIIVIGVSFYKPLFVNRYLIPVTIAEIFLVVFALESIKHTALQKICAAIFFISIIFFNLWYPDKHTKLDIRKTITEINMIKGDDDIILSESPLIFFETIYYSSDKKDVYLYNPNNVAFPWYVGDVIVSQDQMIQNYPPYPTKAFLVHENGTYDVVYRIPATNTQYSPKQTNSL